MEIFYSKLDVVVKIAERCNINCTYCYMFNRGNEEYLSHPIYITDDVIMQSASFLAAGAREINIKVIRIIFHGGEPLMLKKDKFAWMCETFLTVISPHAEVRFTIQTNAMLIDNEWIAIFQKFGISVGVSIDGPAAYNDIERIDHQGRGTHARVVAGLRKLQAATKRGNFVDPGILCVINPNHDPKKSYRHFVDDLGVKRMSFLMPMETHATASPESVARIGDYLCTLFDEWVKDNNPNLMIRVIDEVLKFMTGLNPLNAPELLQKYGQSALLTIASNGTLGIDDDLKPINIGNELGNVRTMSLAKFLNSSGVLYFNKIAYSIPTACLECCWQNHCRGGAQNGSLINRYSVEREFDNPSVFCKGLTQFYSHLASYMLGHGVTLERLTQALDHDDSPYKQPILAIPFGMKKKTTIAIRPTV